MEEVVESHDRARNRRMVGCYHELGGDSVDEQSLEQKRARQECCPCSRFPVIRARAATALPLLAVLLLGSLRTKLPSWRGTHSQWWPGKVGEDKSSLMAPLLLQSALRTSSNFSSSSTSHFVGGQGRFGNNNEYIRALSSSSSSAQLLRAKLGAERADSRLTRGCIRYRGGMSNLNIAMGGAPGNASNQGQAPVPMNMINIATLEQTVKAFHTAPNNEIRMAAERELTKLQNDPYAWQQVPTILESNIASANTKYFALQILEGLVKTRWKILPPDQKEGIKNFLSAYVIRCSSVAADGASMSLMAKINILLLMVVKQEWPHNWPTFIPDLIGACKASEGLCANILKILKMLSEDVFDFSSVSGEMIKAKEIALRQQLSNEFKQIFELCVYVLSSPASPTVVVPALETLNAYLRWVPLQYVVSSPVIAILMKLFPLPTYRNAVLRCLTEIAGHKGEGVDSMMFVNLFDAFLSTLVQMVPPDTDLKVAYDGASMEDREFIGLLASFITVLLKHHGGSIERANQPTYTRGLEYILTISKIRDIEVFRTCLHFWRSFVASFFRRNSGDSAHSKHSSSKSLSAPNADKHLHSTAEARALYSPLLHQIREVLVTRMAKPEEVLIVVDENGNVEREENKLDDERLRYKVMRECMVYLTHLDHDDTEQLLRDKLRQQVTGAFEKEALNVVCWAIGSISGSMHEDQEDRFLVSNIRDLLNLCETVRGKSNKAVIASNIMYVVGQYPRFLRAHWRFLKTVVLKLFEFMHEQHPGVQDMACETLVKVTRRCHRHFSTVQKDESRPFIESIIENMPNYIRDLKPLQIEMFYEAVGVMANAAQDSAKREKYLKGLMSLPNQLWSQIMQRAVQDSSILVQPVMMRRITEILKTNIEVCNSMGGNFLPQLKHLHSELAQVYKHHSESLSKYLFQNGPQSCANVQAKLLRTVRKTALRLYTAFIQAKDSNSILIAQQFLPTLLDVILSDYQKSIPEAREPEALSLFATLTEKLGQDKAAHNLALAQIPRIFEHTFEVTLKAITSNFEDFQEHRLVFFQLLKNINEYFFEVMLEFSDHQTQMVVDSVVWAFRHTERNIAETGMGLCLSMITKYANSNKCNRFFQAYMIKLVQELLVVITDTFHKSNFKLHAMTLQRLIMISESPALTANLWNPPQHFSSNAEYLHHEMISLLERAFPNVHPQEVKQFVDGLYAAKREPPKFKQFMRDFIVHTKEFSNVDCSELWAEGKTEAVDPAQSNQLLLPGMRAPE